MPNDFHAIVIGTGFGANVVASNLAARFPNTTGKPKILMLERGVWWFSPERPFPPPFAANYDGKYPPGDRAQNPYTKHPVRFCCEVCRSWREGDSTGSWCAEC